MSQTKPKTSSGGPSQEQKIWGVAAYLWVLSLVVLVARKNDPYVRFHANQGVLLLALWVVFLLMPPLQIAVILIALVGIFKAFQGEEWEIPVIGMYAAKLGDWLVKTLKV